MDLDSAEHWDREVRRSVSRLFLLAALAERPMHGYEIARAVAEASGNCCAPSDAAIYPAIRDLQAGGYIVCTAEAQGQRVRNVCALTDRGRNALAAADAAWAGVLPRLAEVIAAAPVAVACCEPREASVPAAAGSPRGGTR